MSEPPPAQYVVQRIYEPLELTDLMSADQATQFLEILRAVKERGRGVVMIIVNNGHVRWHLSGGLEDFAVPDNYR